MLNKVTGISNQENRNNSFSYFKNANQVKKGYRSYRYHNTEDPTTGDKVRAAAGSAIGTAIPLVFYARKQNGKINSLKKLFDIEYKLPEMVTITTGAIAGGVVLGMIGESKQKCKRKIDEGIFQFMNAVMPAALVTGFLELTKNNKKLSTPQGKIIGTVVSLCAGMYMGAKASNLITDPKDKYPDRKLNMKDAVANVDDLIGGLVLAKIPLVDKLNIDKTLPVIYSWCGYRAGQNS